MPGRGAWIANVINPGDDINAKGDSAGTVLGGSKGACAVGLGLLWQAAQEVEEIKRVSADKPLRIAPEQARRNLRNLRRLRVDTAVGMGFSNFIAF